MSNWEQFSDWIATLAVASFAWFSGVAADAPASLSAATGSSAPAETQLNSIMRWMQQEEDPPIEQVGEDAAEDVETLDEEAGDVETLDEAEPPADEVDTEEDIELLDQGPPAGAQDDVELLDQGPSPVGAGEAAAPAAVTTAPTSSYVAPVATSGPFVPEGFGTGDVHVATGSAGFPVGLENCHVGAVTGRAYVGIDCGDGSGSSFVGHAPSFEAFPFVLDESFPFDQDSVFANRGTSQIEEDVQTLISTARGASAADETAPVIRTSGTSTVEFEQRARDRKPRTEVENGGAQRSQEARQRRNGEIRASESQDGDDRASAESRHKKKQRGNAGHRGGSDGDGEKKSKNSKQAKKQGGNKGKKNRAD
ncbi:MAG TPA: hypothetical protein VE420_14720 [Gemmatimonadales bacterium]|nr:hypothetical protein [Gemmatimonadales bacterium]